MSSLEQLMALYHLLASSTNSALVDDNEVLAEVKRRADNGSQTAANYLESKRLIAEAMQLLDANDANLDDGAFALIRRAYRLHSLFYCSRAHQAKLLKAMERADPDSPNLLFMRCLAASPDMTRNIKHGLDCLRRFPHDAEFNYFLGGFYGFNQQEHKGLRYIQKAVALEPERHDWLYQLANATRAATNDGRVGNRRHELIDMYRRYIDIAPVDDSLMPNACYYTAMLYAHERNVDMVREFHGKAVEAERQSLPCFEPVGEDFAAKMEVEMFLKRAEESGVDGMRVLGEANGGAKVVCAHCGKKVGMNKFECGCKAKEYCSQNCQKKNWKVHKVECEKEN